jgi:creatinine amidohydrolase
MRWEELSAPEIDALDRNGTIITLPVGSVEQHGRHMPLGTDTMLAQAVALAAAERLKPRVAVLPPPWYGYSGHHMRFAGTVTLKSETLIALVEDIAESVIAHGFKRLLVINGHGGNNALIDLLASRLGERHHNKARIACLTYFALAREAIEKLRESRIGGMGHACEFETSMMQHLRPELVSIAKAVVCYPDPGSPFLNTDLLGSSLVRTYRDFGDLSTSGTFGDPSLATAEKGGEFFEAVVGELVRFIEDFSGWRIQPRD